MWNVGDSVKHSMGGGAAGDTAMLHACDAVDGTGKKRYPSLGVAARFKRTIRDSIDIFRWWRRESQHWQLAPRSGRFQLVRPQRPVSQTLSTEFTDTLTVTVTNFPRVMS